MARIDCPHESDLLTMVQTGRWPERAPDPLRAHVAGCEICADLATALQAVDELQSAPLVPQLPSSGIVWWRAQLRARQEAARTAVRPITATQTLAFAAVVGAVGAVFGATTQWFQAAIRGAGRVFSSMAGKISWPSLPSLPDDLSTVWVGYWVILLVVGIGLVAGAAIVGWGMREER